LNTGIRTLVACVFLCMPNLALADTHYNFVTKNAQVTAINQSAISREDQRELLCMALNVYHEARGSTLTDQQGVAWVTRNRHELSNKKICEVVYEHGRGNAQFSWTINPRILSRYLEKDSWDRAQLIAWQVMKDRVNQDLTSGSTYFYETSTRPVWSRSAVYRVKYGCHWFVKLRN
jgi:N-acetylmuramoyl-L-alanine amidase